VYIDRVTCRVIYRVRCAGAQVQLDDVGGEERALVRAEGGDHPQLDVLGVHIDELRRD
jgi:hypothetical protein